MYIWIHWNLNMLVLLYPLHSVQERKQLQPGMLFARQADVHYEYITCLHYAQNPLTYRTLLMQNVWFRADVSFHPFYDAIISVPSESIFSNVMYEHHSCKSGSFL